MFKKITISFLIILCGRWQSILAQNTSTTPLWIQYMLEPNPNYYKAKAAFDDYWKDSVPKKGKGYKVFKRWEWRVINHLDSAGNVHWPTGALNDLLAAAAGSGTGSKHYGTSGGGGNNGASNCPANGRWTPVGPIQQPWNQTGQPTGIGRIAGMAFDPKDSNTIFICAPQGGIWKTTNNGTTWNQIFGTGPVVNTIGATCMVLSYNNSDTMYVGTGDRDAGDAPGFGVIASWDGGKTWVSRNSGMGNVSVGRMVMDPRNSKILLASTNGGLYRSADGGANWTKTLAGVTWDVVFHPYNPNIVYASLTYYTNPTAGAFFRSTDNGNTFSVVTTGPPASSYRSMIAVTKADRGYVYCLSTSGYAFEGLYRSTDSGATFTKMSGTPNILGYYDGTSATSDLGNGQGWYDLDITADPNNKNTIYSSGVDIWKSTNGGTSWTQVAHWYGGFGADDIHADQHCIEFNITGKKIYGGNDGGIYYTANAGGRWNDISGGIQNSQIYRIAHAKSDAFLSAQGYQDNGSAQTTKDQFYTYYGGDGMDCQVDPTDASYVYGSYVYGSIYRAIDKNDIITLGENGVNGITEGGPWLTPFVLQEGNPSRMFAGYYNIWRCDNTKTTGTPSWSQISNKLAGTNTVQMRFLESSPARNNILYALRSDNKLFRSVNTTSAIPTWVDLTANLPSNARWLEAHPKDSTIVYLCAGTDIYKSRNMGSTWTNITSGLSGVGQIECMALDTSGKNDPLYIGTEKGVYYKDSTMSTWVNYTTGFPIWADVTDLDIYYSPKGKTLSKLVASTYGRGVWRTNLYEDGTVAPVASFYAFDSIFVVGGKMHLYEQIKNSVSSMAWKITPYTYSYTDGTDSTSYNPVIKFNATGIYSVQLSATNCQGTNTLLKSLWMKVFAKSTAAVCNNTTTYQTQSDGNGIMRFTLSDNSNETGGYFDDGQYLDASANKIFRLKPSASYSAIAKTGLYNNEYFRIFIDYNNNGKFENYLGEAVASSSSSFGNRTLTFTTPSALKANIGFRMRILSDRSALDTNACRNLGYGQGEDYTIVYDNPVPYFYANKLSACPLENLVFTDTSIGLVNTWDWDFGSGAVPKTATGKGPHTIYYSTTGSKSVRLRVNGKDSVRKTNYITINTGPIPNIIVKSGTLSGCPGRTLILAARVLNGVPFTVQWQKNGVNLSGKTDTLLTLSNVALSDSGNYSAILSNGSCNSPGQVLKIIVFEKPVAAFSENLNAQCLHYNRFIFTNTSTISVGSIVTNLWRMGDGTTQNSSNSQITYSAVGTYNVKLIATSNKGCIDSFTKTMTVNPNGVPKFSVNDTDQCLSGNSFVFANLSNIASGSLTYNWQFGDGNTSTSASPTKSYATKNIYTVKLITTSNLGCKDTASKPVRVYSQPVVSFTKSATALCLKVSQFNYTNTSTNTDGTMSYLWDLGNGTTAASTNSSVKYTAAGSYNVKLVATTIFGCKDSNTQSITVYPQTKVKFTVNDTDQCLNGNKFIFTNTSSISSGTFLNAWYFGDGFTAFGTSTFHSYATNSNYTVNLITVSNFNCRDTANANVRVYSQPNVSFTINKTPQCLKGNLFTFTNASSTADGTISNLWSLGDGSVSAQNSPVYTYKSSGSFDIKLVVTTSFGCKDSVFHTALVYPKAAVNFTVNDSDQCLNGNNFIFTNKSGISSGSINSYTWNFGDAAISNIASPVHNYAAYGVYPVQLVALSNNICLDTIVKSIRVYAQPKAGFTLLPSLVSCLKYNKFSASSTASIGQGTITTNWFHGDAGNSAGNSDIHSFATAGAFVYKQVVISDFGCKDSTSKNITIYLGPKPSFTLSKATYCENELVVINNTSSISTGTNNYHWEFGQGNTSNLITPTTVYSKYGNYNILLEATSDKGCEDSAIKTVKIASVPLPAFTIAPPAGCAGQTTFTFNDISTNPDSSKLTRNWDFGDASADTARLVNHKYKTAGSYTVKLAIQSVFCNASTSKTQIVSPAVSASFAEQILNKETRRFVALDTIVKGYHYHWFFQDGGGGLGTSIVHTFPSNNNFGVSLKVTNDIGCMDSAGSTIAIKSPNYNPQDNALNFYVYPNPTNNSFTYKFSISETRTVEVKLYDIIGQLPLYTKTWKDMAPGTYYESVNMKLLHLAPATYPLILVSGKDKVEVKIVYVGGQ